MYDMMGDMRRDYATKNECVKERHSLVKGDNLTITARKRCTLVLFTDRKSCMGFRFVLKSMTLNHLARSNDRRRALSLR